MKLSKLSRDDQEIEHFDDFGFDGTPFDRTAEYVPTKPFPSSLQVVAMFAGLVILIIYVSMGILAGYYAWNEFPEDYVLNKVIKTYMAVIFSPMYLLYVFIKVTVFKKPE